MLAVLDKLFASSEEVPNDFDPADRPHVRKLYQAGLLDVAGKVLRITVTGKADLANFRRAGRKAPKRAGMTLTPTNEFALLDLFKHADVVDNQVDAVTAPHARRLIAMGYVEVHGRSLALTAKGREVRG